MKGDWSSVVYLKTYTESGFPIWKVVLHLLNEGGIQKTGVLSILLEEYECAADFGSFHFHNGNVYCQNGERCPERQKAPSLRK